MKWSLKIGSIAGTRLYLHWTFLLLLAWVFMSHLSTGSGTAEALAGVAFVAAIFACVLLHELGHVIAASSYGIPTQDITLLPIGGLARLERLPEKPVQEFWVALAGPAVNVIIAAILFFLNVARGGFNELQVVTVGTGSFWVRLMWANVFLVAFNLLPAFPMDGGRVLRALLAMRLDRRQATRIAASIGQGMAILFGVLGLFINPMLILIAVFVFIGAGGEAQLAELNAVIRNRTVADAMMTRFRTLAPEDSLDAAVQELLAGSQQDFPVVAGGQIIGLLRRCDLAKGLAEFGKDGRVADAMDTECPPVNAADSLENAFVTLHKGRCSSLAVVRNGRLVGLLTLENIGELIMVNSALEHEHKAMPRFAAL